MTYYGQSSIEDDRSRKGSLPSDQQEQPSRFDATATGRPAPLLLSHIFVCHMALQGDADDLRVVRDDVWVVSGKFATNN